VGKRNLESAIKSTHHDVDVRWAPFLLRPNMPPEGTPKAGKGLQNVNPRLRSVGQAVGINFTGECDRAPNSVEAHALLAYAAEAAPAKQNALQEVLFRHYFTDGLYPAGDNLAAAAREAGLDAEKALAYAQDPKNKAKVTEEARRNSASGVTGVPFFRINGEGVFSGAQPPAVMLEAIEEAAQAAAGAGEAA